MRLFKFLWFPTILAGNKLLTKKKSQISAILSLFAASWCFFTLSLSAQVDCKSIITGSTALCKSDSATLSVFTFVTDTSYKYTWSTGETTANITVQPDSTTTYWVTVSNNLCTDTAYATVQLTTVYAVVSGDTVLCEGSNTTLAASGGTSYLWNTGNSGDTTATIIVAPLVDTQYTVTVSNCICPGTAQKSIKVNPLPLLRAEKDTSITPGTSVQLSAIGTGIVKYLWTPSDRLSDSSVVNPVANPQTTITYILTGTDNNGCINIDSVLITLLKLDCDPYIPNAFSPNSDGQNDLLKIHGDCIKEFSLSIYDRWGEKVFETMDINEGWDGTYKGKPMNSGVFVYCLTVIYTDGEEISKNGNITLIR